VTIFKSRICARTVLRWSRSAIRVHRRRVDIRAADDRRDQGGLGRRQLMNLFAEIRARRRAHAPDRDGPTLSEVDLVEVGLEDPFFE